MTIQTIDSAASTMAENRQQLVLHDTSSMAVRESPYQTIADGMDMGANGIQQQSLQQNSAAYGEEGDESARLRAEVQQLKSDAVAKEAVLDDMMADLLDTENKLDATKSQLAAKVSECADLRSQLDQTVNNDNNNNSTALQPWGALQPAPYFGALGPAAAAGGITAPGMMQYQTQQKQFDDFAAALRSRDELLRLKDRELADEQSAQLQLSQTIARLEQEKETACAAQARAEGALAEATAAASSQQDGRVEELQKHVRFFKNNSERHSQTIRELTDRNKQLMEELGVAKEELQYEAAMNRGLKGKDMVPAPML